MCGFCGSHSETIQQLMWQCTKIQVFWKHFFKLLQQRCSHMINLQLNKHLILFGYSTSESLDNILLLIILMAKCYIYRNKVQKTLLNPRLFLKEVYNRYNIEMNIHNNNEQFEKSWAPYLLLFKSLL